jgi:hypothetical protein
MWHAPFIGSDFSRSESPKLDNCQQGRSRKAGTECRQTMAPTARPERCSFNWLPPNLIRHCRVKHVMRRRIIDCCSAMDAAAGHPVDLMILSHLT